MTYPWEDPSAPEHVRNRAPVMEILAPAGIRRDLPRRRPRQELPEALQNLNYGIVIMSHRGYSNGRLSVLLSSIPENYPVVVSDDAVAPHEIEADREVALHHGADYAHCSPWGGRAKNARHCMLATNWEITLFLCDDVWLFPETCLDALRWYYTFTKAGVPLACLRVPGWETWENWRKWGYESWQQCLTEPWRFEAIPPNPAFDRCPAIYKNPFGACMVMNRTAYDDLGGFAPEYWAHDDVYNHKVWLSGRWVNAGYPGRGYMHLGAQSWHHGESVEYVGEFKDATGMTAEESGAAQTEFVYKWKAQLGQIFLDLGGTPGV